MALPRMMEQLMGGFSRPGASNGGPMGMTPRMMLMQRMRQRQPSQPQGLDPGMMPGAPPDLRSLIRGPDPRMAGGGGPMTGQTGFGMTQNPMVRFLMQAMMRGRQQGLNPGGAPGKPQPGMQPGMGAPGLGGMLGGMGMMR